MAYLLKGIQNRLVSILRAACVLPAGVDVITVRVDDVVMARADEGRMRLGAALARSVCFLLASRSVTTSKPMFACDKEGRGHYNDRQFFLFSVIHDRSVWTHHAAC